MYIAELLPHITYRKEAEVEEARAELEPEEVEAKVEAKVKAEVAEGGEARELGNQFSGYLAIH